MALELKLEEKPFYWGLIIGLLVSAIVVVGLEYFYFNGLRKQNEAKQQQLAQLESKIAEGRAAEKKIVQFKEEVRKLELELDKLLRILPSTYNADELIKKLETLANQGELAVKRISSGRLVPKEFYSEWPITIMVDGSYHNLALFFEKISRFSRIINIDQLQITAIAQGAEPTRSIAAQFIAKTFIYQGDRGGAQ